MPMNVSRGNMYGFVNRTWNTVKGRCPHDCSYCYMKRFGRQKPVHFDERELKTDLGKDNFIFVGSSCDMFADSIPRRWIEETIYHINKYDNDYLLQTKNPKRFFDFRFSPKTILCTTIETNRENDLANTPDREERYRVMRTLRKDKTIHITIEPIMDFDPTELARWIIDIAPEQTNIGANTNRNVALPEPDSSKIEKLIRLIDAYTKVHLKKNIRRLFCPNNM